MDLFSTIVAFLFGAIVGSFLNVVSLRFNTGVGLGGRSKCMSCGKTLSWLELFPILSFLALRGKCRGCKSKISWQYPLVEFIAGAIFVMIFFVFPPISYFASIATIIQIIIGCLLLVIVIYDIKHKIIPDQLSYTFSAFALASLFIGGASLWHIPTYWQLLAGPIIALPFVLLWLVSRGNWMGLGDGKLMLGIGWLLGINGGVNAVVLAFWIGAVVSVVWLLYTHKKFKPRTEIPFGPYLVLGLYLVLLFKITVIDLHIIKDIIAAYIV
ncbi:MAG: prepilin peptidase [Candidatus Taylorbacteria bacterium]